MTEPIQPQDILGMEHGQVSPGPGFTPDPAPNGVAPPAPRLDPWDPPIGPDGVADFTPRKPRPTFRISGETYFGKVEIPTGPALKYSSRAAKLNESDEDEDMEETFRMFRLMLQKESAERMISHLHMIPADADDDEIERLSQEADEDGAAIGLETFMHLLPWLLEQYGMAPTSPSSGSESGSPPSPDDGQNSTETTPAKVSTSSPSPSIEG
jgi:hypothetical protein